MQKKKKSISTKFSLYLESSDKEYHIWIKTDLYFYRLEMALLLLLLIICQLVCRFLYVWFEHYARNYNLDQK